MQSRHKGCAHKLIDAMMHTPFDVKRHKNHPYHLGSIALNNIAVSLLERAEYWEALETMKDSINLMKVFCRPNGPHNATDVDSMLFNATHRCLHCSSSRQDDDRSTSETSIIQCRNIHHDLHFWFAMEKMTRPTTSASTSTTDTRTTIPTTHRPCRHLIFPIRIDECLCGFGEPDFESAILLHNFALAYYCLGHVKVRGTDEWQYYQTHRQTAIQLWDNAQDVLKRFYKCKCHTYLQPTACLVSIAILHSLIPLRLSVEQTQQQHQRRNGEEHQASSSSPSGHVNAPTGIAHMTETMKWCCSIVVTQYQTERMTSTVASAA